ncbi:hypothetical protein HYW58_02015 [Candidatus Kaiserbacteria bacterium]|nr:hypothetical protein [Candidatus Kaiserbacteria bacterium]
MFSVGIFFFSLIGVVSLVGFRMWEIQQETRLFNIQRARLDEFVRRVQTYVRTRMPVFGHLAFARMYHTVAHRLALFMLSVLKAVEKRVIRLLEYLRGKRDIQKGVTQSEFLRKVSEHKRNLENPSRDAIE